MQEPSSVKNKINLNEQWGAFIIDTIIYRSLYEWLVLGRKIVPHKKLFPVVRIHKGDECWVCAGKQRYLDCLLLLRYHQWCDKSVLNTSTQVHKEV